MSTPTPQARIQEDLKTAMKAGEKEKVGTLRMLLTELKNEKIRAGEEVDEARFLALVQKAIKQRGEAASQFRDGDRLELAEKEEREAAILEPYLPAQLSEDEIRAKVEAYVAAHELSGMKAMGAAMKGLRDELGASADGKVLSTMVREVLSAS